MKISTFELINTQDSKSSMWFQYRLIHCILATQRLLYNIGKVQSEERLLCQFDTESIKHVCLTSIRPGVD